MAIEGEWIQPDDMWVGRPVDVHTETWSRTILWDPADLDPGDVTPAFVDRWSWVTEDIGSEFVARPASNPDIIAATEESDGDAAYPLAAYQTRFPDLLQSWQLFVEMGASTLTDDNPQYDPPRDEGVEVEYESEEGEYHNQFEFQIPYDTEGDFAVDGQSRPYFAYDKSNALTRPGRASGVPTDPWQTDWDRYGAINGDFGTVPLQVDYTGGVFEESRAFLTFAVLFDPHVNGPNIDEHRTAEMTLGRWSPTIPRPFGAARRYTPPRYRLIYPGGMWSLQHQATGHANAGGWPLQHRHNAGATGSWPLQHRATGF